MLAASSRPMSQAMALAMAALLPTVPSAMCFPAPTLVPSATELAPATYNVITNYNHNFAGQPTPAGQTLINSGLFTLGQLQSLQGVQQVIPAAPYDEAGM